MAVAVCLDLGGGAIPLRCQLRVFGTRFEVLGEAQFGGVVAASIVGTDATGVRGVFGSDVGVGGLQLLGEGGVDEVGVEVGGRAPSAVLRGRRALMRPARWCRVRR